MPRVTTGRHLTRLGRGGFAFPPPDPSPQLSLVEGGLFLPTSRRGPTFVEAAGLSTAVREVPENAVTMFFLPISTSLPVRLTKRRGLREAYRRALPLRESETSVVGASSFVVPAGAAQNAQSKSTGGAQEALQESMRLACGQARRRPRQWLRANASTPFFQFSPTSGLTALSLAEVYS